MAVANELRCVSSATTLSHIHLATRTDRDAKFVVEASFVAKGMFTREAIDRRHAVGHKSPANGIHRGKPGR